MYLLFLFTAAYDVLSRLVLLMDMKCCGQLNHPIPCGYDLMLFINLIIDNVLQNLCIDPIQVMVKKLQ